MPRARPEGSGRKPREQGMGAASATARSLATRPGAEVRQLEAILGRENMMAALRRVDSVG
jgi:RNA-directed DNA polymerase